MPLAHIRIYVPQEFWERLYAGTKEWPKNHRNPTAICRYALHELYADWELPETVLPKDGPPEGPKSIQTCSLDPVEIRHWDEMASSWGSRGAALKVALQYLLDILEREIDE